MIIRSLKDIKDTHRDVTTTGKWNSVRLLTASDEMGFSLHVTTIVAGVSLPTHYEHHLEAVYCLKGHGVLTYNEGGEKYMIEPGTMYALNRHDKHVLTAEEELILVCVFNPPVVGHERHNPAGGYNKSA